ncbi:MAG: HDOD domain-containing protein [Gammaproteobacteria bacterium]|nr:HDOD domain-containing protein [Gammaproteobacteria bacterium]
MPPTPNNSILPGYIGRFRIISELGKGAQGIVYLASDTQLERNVAIKTIQFERPTAKLKTQFLKESRTVSKLQHPGIITLYEADEHLGKPYLVFEYVDGISLKEHLIKNGKLSPKDAINILAPVLNAIAYAHKRGVVHRDLSPDNIMLTEGNGKPRLMDFGIASLLGNKSDDGIWGTLKYLSPEQCENKDPIPSSDIFTLGLILFEMLTGKPAIEVDNKFAAINKIVNEEIVLPDSIAPALKNIIKKALEKMPEARYADALDMRQDLLKHLHQIAPDVSSAASNENSSDNSTLNFLLRRMEHKKDFPTMSHQVVEISQKAQAGNEFSANALSNAILKDYSLSTKLLRLVNSPMYGHYGGRISTISRAVVILGFEEVRNAALGLILLDHLKDKNQASSLKEACISSMMSGSIANGLAHKLRLRDMEEAYVCSMFHNLGKLLAIYYFPDEAEVIQDVVKHKQMKENHAAESVLGVSYEEIGIAVGESWQLPTELIESMHTLPPGELKKPLSQSDLLKHVSGFSNEYCELISTTTAEERQQNFETLASRYNNTVTISRAQMDDIVSNAVNEMQKYAQLVNLDLKQSTLFSRASSWSSKTENNATDTSNNDAIISETSASEELSRQQNILHAIQEITDAILEGASLNDILVMVMETIYSGFGFTRVMFCFINKSRTSIIARFGFGRDVEILTQRFSIPLGGEKDIFNQALTQCKDLVIEDVNSTDCKDLIPDWYRDKYAKNSMLVYPIVVKNIPMGILYIDSITPISIGDESRLSMIKTLRNQIVLAIRQST